MKLSMKLKKKWGQHLLVSPGILKKIVEFAEIKPGETIVEIGPGPGNLTREILKTPLKKLYLIEIDPEMVETLKQTLKDERVKIFLDDATTFDFSKLQETSLKLIGNLPYNVASLIIENTVNYKNIISLALYMVQKEVAERLLQNTSWLSVFVNTFYKVQYLMSIPPRFFLPPPKVDSALIKLEKKENPPILNLKVYKKFLLQIFSKKRKKLRHKLDEKILKKANISPDKRVEELRLEEFIYLYRFFEEEFLFQKR